MASNGRPYRRIAVIGAGVSGLTSIKACLDEGLEPVSFERDAGLGGLWRYSEDAGKPSVYKSCVINTSKEMMAFSDFPVPRDFPTFMPHGDVLRYLDMYAGAFGLNRYVRYGRHVVRVEPVAGARGEGVKRDSGDGVRKDSGAGRWRVTTVPTGEDPTRRTPVVEEFDGVMLCSGHLWKPHMPSIQGLSTCFRGKVVHSAHYRTAEAFVNKRVLIVGIGNSAADIAVTLSNVASKVFVSTRRGAWVVGRMGPYGLPMDALANSRVVFTLPRPALQWMVERMANFKFDHNTYGLQAQHRALESHPTISDDLPIAIMSGKVTIVDNVRCFTEHSAVLDNGLVLDDIDVVVVATGYTYSYPYIDNGLLGLTGENDTHLYKFMYSPKIQDPRSLAVVGLVQPIGAIMPCSELQARWAARVFTGKSFLPSRDFMAAEIVVKRALMEQHYYAAKRHKLETFWIDFMDEIAEEVGCKPDFRRMLPQEPLLALRCLVGPCVPAQYRLDGPGAKPALARTVISGTLANSVYALNKYRCTNAFDDNNNAGKRRSRSGSSQSTDGSKKLQSKMATPCKVMLADARRRSVCEVMIKGRDFVDELIILFVLICKIVFSYLDIADHILRLAVKL